MDKWLFYGTLEMDAPYDRRRNKCIVRGVRSLHIDTAEMLVVIFINRLQSRSGRITFISRNLSMVAIFSFYGNCLHECLKERLRNLEISSNWHIICSYIINDSTKVYAIRTIILRISCKCSNVPFSVIWSLHDHTLVFLRNHNGQNYWYK